MRRAQRLRPAERPLPEARDEDFREAVLSGLRRPQKAISAKYLYDAEGSALFDRICELEEYYPTRTETAVLRQRAREIAMLSGEQVVLVEFGAGSGIKVRILLDCLTRPQAYLPIDISGEHLLNASESLAQDYPSLTVTPVVGDFTQAIELPEFGAGMRLGFFPGSTIGNFDPPAAAGFLAGAGETLGPGSALLLGVDLKKDPKVLHAAYNDRQGVTAAFNLNLLRRINRELGGTFQPARFRHKAFYNESEGRIEMHIESLVDQSVKAAGEAFDFAAGETIHTENSYKYAPRDFARLAESAGWQEAAFWTDPKEWFGVWFLRRKHQP